MTITKAFDRGYEAGRRAQAARNAGNEPEPKECPYSRRAQLNAWHYGYQHGSTAAPGAIAEDES